MSMKLRKAHSGHIHWCPACKAIHVLPSEGWAFNGNMEKPNFTPSFKHSWSNSRICHYVLTAGVLNYCDDSTHGVRGAVPLPDLPAPYGDTDEVF